MDDQLRRRIATALDVSGGIAGTFLVFGGAIALLVALPDLKGAQQALISVGIPMLILGAGAWLALKKDQNRIRMIVGALFLIFVITSFAAVIFFPNLHRVFS